jgi:HAUS augmin-like complex subunit 1
MDNNNLDLLPSALFSPSKAAQQRAQAQDWHHVDTWLASKYQGRSVPQFERNEDTLKAFLALVAANEKADEDRDVLWSIQKEALSDLKSQGAKDDGPTSNNAILNSLGSSLSPEAQASLDALANAFVTLDSPAADPTSIANTIITQTQSSHTLSQTLLRVSSLQRRLENELITLRSQLAELRSPAFQAPLSLQRQTLEWSRNTKQLRTKIGEYTERLGSLEGKDNGLIEDVVRRERSVTELTERVKDLEAQVEAFKGLPKDKDAARREVEKASKELASLQRRRDKMFEALVEKG